MAKFLLHGLWVQHSGLHLWLEQVAGHRIVLPDAVAPGTLPAAAEQLVSAASFRHRLRTTLRTPKGREVALTIPTAAFGPAEVMTVLAQLSFLDEPGPAATTAQRAAIGADLMWLIRMYRGLSRFVRAGRVVLKLSYEDNEWYPQWQLSQGLEERGWVAAMAAAAPGVLVVNNRNLSEDIAETWPHWIATDALSDLPSPKGVERRHEFTRALLGSEPLRRGGVGLLNRLNEWKESIAAVDIQLVAIVEQPDESDTDQLDPESALWPVRIQVRSAASAPQPVRSDRIDRGSMELARQRYAQACSVSSLIDAARYGRDAARAVPVPAGLFTEAPGQERVGDWDVYLTSEQIVDFVTTDAPRLREHGVNVMLPRAWTVFEAHAKLETAPVPAEPGSSTRPRVGMNQLMEFNWRLSLGDDELNDAEMRELIDSKSGLVKLRGQWVMADRASVRKITDYMQQLSERSARRAKERLAELNRQVDAAKALGQEDWRELAARRDEYREKVARLEAEEAGELTVGELRELALESAAEQPVEIGSPDWYSGLIGGAAALTAPAPQRVALPDTVHADLREYQRRGVDWLYWMSRNNLGAVLADDMGLGKTLQLLALVAVERARDEASGPTLVVAPTSVVSNWAAEAAHFVPDFEVAVHHGSGRLTGEEFLRRARTADLVITSYGVATRDCVLLGGVDWDHVVLDEAQHVKNPSTRSSRAVRAIPTRHRIALTGTPMENHLAEMRSILDFTNPGVLGNASFFRNHFAKPIERDHDEGLAGQLRRLSAPFILRRLKTDPAVVDDLPEKNEHVVTVRMTSEQAALYQAYVEDVQRRITSSEGMARRGLILASLTRIKQICNHPAHFLGDGSAVTRGGRHRSGKVAQLVSLLDAAVAGEERVLIFTQYRAFGQLLQPYLSERFGEDIPFLHGGVSRATRAKMVDRFQSPDGPPAMLLSLKAGGTGLNLTAASVVIHMDRWWNPAVENQATDRAYRIGQRKDVTVYKMITAGTLEESIQDILDGKSQLAGAVIGQGEGWITELDPEQLAELMSYRSVEY
ncbi:ATP-dependent helicase [Corynebacterium atypicum]|uniref:ATP-dependent helicase n=1 Tax=Corynebacterium atypicum TaxID=191610 RepID=A0ABM5QNL4_9CORY|nr:DEAD/DEAH box helicase [Corynebacterium atypicum]AIG64337.1 ATP-dependent helicase [Corynebacterium atypicum]